MKTQVRMARGRMIENGDVGRDHRIGAAGCRVVDGTPPDADVAGPGEGVDGHQNLRSAGMRI